MRQERRPKESKVRDSLPRAKKEATSQPTQRVVEGCDLLPPKPLGPNSSSQPCAINGGPSDAAYMSNSRSGTAGTCTDPKPISSTGPSCTNIKHNTLQPGPQMGKDTTGFGKTPPALGSSGVNCFVFDETMLTAAQKHQLDVQRHQRQRQQQTPSPGHIEGQHPASLLGKTITEGHHDALYRTIVPSVPHHLSESTHLTSLFSDPVMKPCLTQGASSDAQLSVLQFAGSCPHTSLHPSLPTAPTHAQTGPCTCREDQPAVLPALIKATVPSTGKVQPTHYGIINEDVHQTYPHAMPQSHSSQALQPPRHLQPESARGHVEIHQQPHPASQLGGMNDCQVRPACLLQTCTYTDVSHKANAMPDSTDAYHGQGGIGESLVMSVLNACTGQSNAGQVVVKMEEGAPAYVPIADPDAWIPDFASPNHNLDPALDTTGDSSRYVRNNATQRVHRRQHHIAPLNMTLIPRFSESSIYWLPIALRDVQPAMHPATMRMRPPVDDRQTSDDVPQAAPVSIPNDGTRQQHIMLDLNNACKKTTQRARNVVANKSAAQLDNTNAQVLPAPGPRAPKQPRQAHAPPEPGRKGPREDNPILEHHAHPMPTEPDSPIVSWHARLMCSPIVSQHTQPMPAPLLPKQHCSPTLCQQSYLTFMQPASRILDLGAQPALVQHTRPTLNQQSPPMPVQHIFNHYPQPVTVQEGSPKLDQHLQPMPVQHGSPTLTQKVTLSMKQTPPTPGLQSTHRLHKIKKERSGTLLDGDTGIVVPYYPLLDYAAAHFVSPQEPDLGTDVIIMLNEAQERIRDAYMCDMRLLEDTFKAQMMFRGHCVLATKK